MKIILKTIMIKLFKIKMILKNKILISYKIIKKQ